MLKSRDFSRKKCTPSHSEGVGSAVSNILAGLKKGSQKLLPAMILTVAVSAGGAAFDFAPTFLLSPALAASGSLTDLDKMELKFFHHTYPKEDQGERLDRLEKMFFGEAKEGPPNERFSKLKELVPDLDQVQAKEPAAAESSSRSATAGGGRSSGRGSAGQSQSPEVADDRPDEGTAYPAITAIEQRKLGKTFESEPVGSRLARLEKKVFGQSSNSNDYTDRMDRLKSATGVDIARQAPPGTEWGDDEVDVDYPTPSQNLPRQTVRRPTYSQGEDGRSFSGRDLREDMRRAFGNRYPGSSASGSYGMTGGSATSGTGSSGSYGFGSSSSSGSGVGAGVGLIPNDRSTTAYAPPSSSAGGYPPTAPPIQRSAASKPMGLNQQVDLLEGQIFGHSYSSDTLPDRVARLEKTIFPSQNISKNLGLPARVFRLTSVVAISNSGNMISSAPAPAPPYNSNQGYPSNQNDPRNRPRGGLSKILNSMGNFVGGGFSVGSYPMNGNLVTDPQTGLYLDRATGNLIDPSTGMVVGRRGASSYGNVSPGYGYRSFNNGFAPSITPYNYGVGGTGIRFGTGYGTGFGTGFGGVGGMWP